VAEADDTGWANPKVLTVLLLIFICGGAVGSAATRWYLHARMPQQHASHVQIDGIGLDKLKADLNLTPEQEKIVMKELDDYAKYYQNIEDEREDVALHGLRRIFQILTPEQQKRFRELFGPSVAN
jgi:hypothetical protein